MSINTNCCETSWQGHNRPKCGKPYTYVGDIPPEGFQIGLEPYCTCGTEICKKCGQRFIPKPCEHES